MRAALLAMGLSGCLRIDDAEDASRRRVGALMGDYSGDWSVALSLTERAQAHCSGSGTGAVTGAVWGDPLSLNATFTCTTTGLVELGGREELTLTAALDSALSVADSGDGEVSGEMSLGYQDSVGSPTWSATLDEDGAQPVISGLFAGSADVSLAEDVEFSGTFTLTHAAD